MGSGGELEGFFQPSRGSDPARELEEQRGAQSGIALAVDDLRDEVALESEAAAELVLASPSAFQPRCELPLPLGQFRLVRRHSPQLQPHGCTVNRRVSSHADPPENAYVAEPWENTEVAKRIDVARAQTIDPATGKTMTQGELERRVGMTKPGERGTGYIAKLRKGERGTSLKIEWIVKLARELNVRYEWLYAGVGPMRAPEGAAPGGGRDLGLFMAAQAGRPPEIIEQVRQELEGDEHAQMDPILVLNMVEHAWQVSRGMCTSSSPCVND